MWRNEGLAVAPWHEREMGGNNPTAFAPHSVDEGLQF